VSDVQEQNPTRVGADAKWRLKMVSGWEDMNVHPELSRSRAKKWNAVYEGTVAHAPGQVKPVRARTCTSCRKIASCGSRDSTSIPGFSMVHQSKNSSILLESWEKLSGVSQVHWSRS